jgi:hypothetical protein
VTTTDAGLMPLVMQLGRARASVMDVPVLLGSLCSVLPAVVGVAGAVLLLTEPPAGARTLTASDARAGWIGEMQQRAGAGPLPEVMRTRQPVFTADLTRIGPPAVATAAAECGLVSSLVVPVEVDGERVGVLQLLGEAQRPVEPAHADIVRPLLDVLAARLVDVRALQLAAASQPGTHGPVHVDPSASTNGSAVVARPAPAPREAGQAPDRTATNGQTARAADADAPARKSRSRRGSHASRDGGSPGEDTTRALPAVPTRRPTSPSGASSDASLPPEPRRPEAPRSFVGQRRSGRHSA